MKNTKMKMKGAEKILFFSVSLSIHLLFFVSFSNIPTKTQKDKQKVFALKIKRETSKMDMPASRLYINILEIRASSSFSLSVRSNCMWSRLASFFSSAMCLSRSERAASSLRANSFSFSFFKGTERSLSCYE